MNLGVSPITNNIYAGTSKDCGNGIKRWVGKQYNVTDEAIKAVFQWFINNYKENEPNEAFEVTFPSSPYVLRMTKKEQNKCGKWLRPFIDQSAVQCPLCKSAYSTLGETPYCPECGAKMEVK